MGVVWAASAYATAPSERTFAATAALIGIARFAFTSDIAARSGSSSPASSLSSSRDSFLNCWSLICVLLIGLGDVGRLLGIRECDRVVRQRVQRDGSVDRCRHVCVQQGHSRPLGQLLARKLVQLLTAELL